MGNLKSIKAKLMLWRILKVAFYLAGLPLLLLLTKLNTDSVSGGVMGETKLGIIIAAAAWLIVVLAQIIVGLIFRKKEVKAVIVAIIAFAVVLLPLLYINNNVKETYDKLEEKYKDSSFEMDNFELFANKYKDKVQEHDQDIQFLMKPYNIEVEHKTYHATNTDLTEYTGDVEAEDFFLEGFGGIEHYIFGKDAGGADYSMNGMYADGYRFGYNQFSYIMRTYYGARAEFKDKEKDIDQELISAIAALETNNDSLWNSYKNTVEYRTAYNPDGRNDDVLNAKNYYITPERIDEILKALKTVLENNPKAATNLDAILNIIGAIVPAVGQIGDLKELSFDKIITMLEDMEVDPNSFLSLLEGFSYYQSPTTYPVFFFIQDEMLRDYAYAKYFAETHGAKIGSILVSEVSESNANPRIGEVTLSSNGSEPIPEEKLLKLLDRFDAEREIMPEVVKYLVMRDALQMAAGLAPFSILIAYFFASLEKRQFDKLTVKGGDK